MSAFGAPADERAPLLRERLALEQVRRLPAELSRVGETLLWSAPYICCSAVMVNFNKVLLADRFPYPVALTWCHALATSACAWGLLLGAGHKRRAQWFPQVERVRELRAGRLPLYVAACAVAFVGSVVLQNEAFRFCSVPFLQSCKQLNCTLVYALAILFGQEVFSPQVVLALALVVAGVLLTASGEFHLSGQGVVLQLSGQLSDCVKVTMQAALVTSAGIGLDPLTALLLLSPLSVLVLTPLVPNAEVLDHVFWARLADHRWLLAANCAAAVLLNVCILFTVKRAGGLAFVLLGVVKYFCIVGLAQAMTGVRVSFIQVVGYTIATTGLFLHSAVKAAPSAKEDLSPVRQVV